MVLFLYAFASQYAPNQDVLKPKVKAALCHAYPVAAVRDEKLVDHFYCQVVLAQGSMGRPQS